MFRRTNTFSPGIIVGFNRMPIDYDILKNIKEIGYDPDYAEKCIDANKHNHITTAYYLLLKSHLKNGGKSKADINSSCFDVSLLESKPRPAKTNNVQIMSIAGMIRCRTVSEQGLVLGQSHSEKQPSLD